MTGAVLRLGLRQFAWPDVRRTAVLALALPMFGQSFHYIVDVLPAYYLSKAWPVLMAPLALYALLRGEPPWRGFYLVLLGWVVAMPLLMSVIYFGQPFMGALGTLAKTMPISYALSFTGLLLWLRPTLREIEQVCVWLGAITFVVMAVLWVVVPEEAYRSDAGVTKLFLWEQERGYRIYMPMFFGVIFMLYHFRRGLDGRWFSFLIVAVCFLLVFSIYKQRVTIAAFVLTAAIAAFRHSMRWRVLMILAAGVGLLLLVPVVFHLQSVAIEATESLGGSLSVRQNSVRVAFDFLNESFVRWLFGVGTLARVNDMTLQQFFNTPLFYLADIGWLGIVFEYGLIGAVLLAGIYIVPLAAKAELTGPEPGPFIEALGDYIVFLCLSSAVYSIIFVPGEATTIFAIFGYIALVRRQARLSRPGGEPRFVRPSRGSAGSH